MGQTISVVREKEQDWVHLPKVRVRLELSNGTAEEAALELRPLTIGSSPECDLVCADPQVSRRHCQVSLTSQGVELVDPESKNGTFVAGVRISRGWLLPGQIATIGSSRLTVITADEMTQLPLSSQPRFGAALGSSVPMRALFAQLERAAKTDATLLIRGETGTGKEVLARAVHEHSPRAEGPFVVVDCGGVPEELLENELFGHEPGAFTGASTMMLGAVERANGGTLFLDEIGELPMLAQTKLLRVLEERTIRRIGGGESRKVDVRVLAATHRDLGARVTSGEFREDLYFRVSVLELIVPPLRDRLDDLELLVEKFLSMQSPPRTLAHLPGHVFEMFRAHQWPGNVRELRNVVTRLAVFPEATNAMIENASSDGPQPPVTSPHFALPLREARDAAAVAFERAYLIEKLRQSGDNVSAAAKAMGVSRQFVYRLMAQHDLRSANG